MFGFGKKNKSEDIDVLEEGFGGSNKLTATDAIKKIKKMSTVDEIKKFTKGDDRKTVYSAADSRMEAITSDGTEKKEKKAPKPAPSR